jgi:hypothetical protein
MVLYELEAGRGELGVLALEERRVRGERGELGEVASRGVVHRQRLVGVTEADMHVETARQAAAENPRVLAGDLPVARTVGDPDRPRRGRMRPGSQQPHPPTEPVDEAQPGGSQLRAEAGDSGRHGRDELDLRGPELRRDARIVDSREHRLDLVGRLE